MVIKGSFIVGGVVMVFAFLHDLLGLGFGDNLAPVVHNGSASAKPASVGLGGCVGMGGRARVVMRSV